LAFAATDLGERHWCSGDAYSLADIALGCALGFLEFRLPEIAWRGPYANLARHADKLFGEAPFRTTAPK
jgi:glutathione S-transferase